MLLRASQLFRNFVRGRLKAWGASDTQRKIWNQEFADGRWDYIDHTPNDCIYDYIGKYCKGGSILDLGCGSGNTGNEMPAEHYTKYTGVDISDVAVEKAIARTAENKRSNKNRYFVSDIAVYAPGRKYDVILFRESIWYIPRRKLLGVLQRFRTHIEDAGVFIVRIYDRQSKGDIVELIKTNFNVVEEHLENQSKDIVLVFR